MQVTTTISIFYSLIKVISHNKIQQLEYLFFTSERFAASAAPMEALAKAA